MAKNPSPDPAAAGPLCRIVQTKAQALCSLPQRGASLGLASRPAARFISHWLLQPAPQKSSQINSSPRSKSHPPPKKRACYRTPGRACVPEPVNNLILNFRAGGVLLLLNSRGRPRRTQALRALIVSAISTRCWRSRRWDGPGIRSGAFPRPRSRNPFPPRPHQPMANHNTVNPRTHLSARRQNENSITTPPAAGSPMDSTEGLSFHWGMRRVTDSSAPKYSKTFLSAASATVRGLLSTV